MATAAATSTEHVAIAGTYTVDRILAARGHGKSRRFLVKWLGYDDEAENTWEPAAHLHPKVVASFERGLLERERGSHAAAPERSAKPSGAKEAAPPAPAQVAEGAPMPMRQPRGRPPKDKATGLAKLWDEHVGWVPPSAAIEHPHAAVPRIDVLPRAAEPTASEPTADEPRVFDVEVLRCDETYVSSDVEVTSVEGGVATVEGGVATEVPPGSDGGGVMAYEVPYVMSDSGGVAPPPARLLRAEPPPAHGHSDAHAATKLTKPRGRPPKGKVWHEYLGYVPVEGVD